MTKVEINRLLDEIVGIKQYHRRLEAINNPDELQRPIECSAYCIEFGMKGFDYKNWEIESNIRKPIKWDDFRF